MKKKSLLMFIVPAFIFVAGIIAPTASWIWGMGEPELPSKFGQ